MNKLTISGIIVIVVVIFTMSGCDDYKYWHSYEGKIINIDEFSYKKAVYPKFSFSFVGQHVIADEKLFIKWEIPTSDTATTEEENKEVQYIKNNGLIFRTLRDFKVKCTIKAREFKNPVVIEQTITITKEIIDLKLSGASTLAWEAADNKTTSFKASENYPLSWSSSNEAVATVDSAGLVSAISAGTATITATINSAADGTAGNQVELLVQGTQSKEITITQGIAPKITSFSFLKADNGMLSKDYIAIIIDGKIKFLMSQADFNLVDLKPTFATSMGTQTPQKASMDLTAITPTTDKNAMISVAKNFFENTAVVTNTEGYQLEFAVIQ